jgi:chorismate-pyruvate lyase
LTRAAIIGVVTAMRITPSLALLAFAPVLNAAPWPDSPLTRLQAEALLESFTAEVLASRSATQTLQQWCAAHALARETVIRAQVLPETRAADAEVRADLKVDAREPLRYRRVQLRCGDELLSVADNWYVPSRLTAAMNAELDHTQSPFGTVVQPLQPHREILVVRRLWRPLPEGWERAKPPSAGGTLALPEALLELRALVLAGAQPIAEVRESYQRGLLDFSPPWTP